MKFKFLIFLLLLSSLANASNTEKEKKKMNNSKEKSHAKHKQSVHFGNWDFKCCICALPSSPVKCLVPSMSTNTCDSACKSKDINSKFSLPEGDSWMSLFRPKSTITLENVCSSSMTATYAMCGMPAPVVPLSGAVDTKVAFAAVPEVDQVIKSNGVLPCNSIDADLQKLPHCQIQLSLGAGAKAEMECYLTFERTKKKNIMNVDEQPPFYSWKHGLGVEKEHFKLFYDTWALPSTLNDDKPLWCPRLYNRFCSNKYTLVEDIGTPLSESAKEEAALKIDKCISIYLLLHQGKVLQSQTLDATAPLGFPINPMNILLFQWPEANDEEAAIEENEDFPALGWHALRIAYTSEDPILTEDQINSICNIQVRGQNICGIGSPSEEIAQQIIKDVAVKIVNDMRLIAAKSLLELAIESDGTSSNSKIDWSLGFANCPLEQIVFDSKRLFTPFDSCSDTRCVSYDASGSDDVGSDYDINLKGCREYQAAQRYNKLFEDSYGAYVKKLNINAETSDVIFDTNVYSEDYLGMDLKGDKSSTAWLDGWYAYLSSFGQDAKAKFHVSHLVWSLFKVRMYSNGKTDGLKSGLEEMRPQVYHQLKYKGELDVTSVRQRDFLSATNSFWDSTEALYRTHNVVLLMKINELMIIEKKLDEAQSLEAYYEKSTFDILRELNGLKETQEIIYKKARNFLYYHAVEINRATSGESIDHLIARDHISGFAGAYAFEAFVSRGPVWFIVGVTQVDNKAWRLEYPEIFGSFNEQVGDLLKEVTEHCSHLHLDLDRIEDAYEGLITFQGADSTRKDSMLKAGRCAVVGGKYLMRIGTNFNVLDSIPFESDKDGVRIISKTPGMYQYSQVNKLNGQKIIGNVIDSPLNIVSSEEKPFSFGQTIPRAKAGIYPVESSIFFGALEPDSSVPNFIRSLSSRGSQFEDLRKLKGKFGFATSDKFKIASALALFDSTLLPVKDAVKLETDQIVATTSTTELHVLPASPLNKKLEPVPHVYDASFVNEMTVNSLVNFDWTDLNLFKNVVDFARIVNEYGYSRILSELNCWNTKSLKDVCKQVSGVIIAGSPTNEMQNGHIKIPKLDGTFYQTEWFIRSLLCPMNLVQNDAMTECIFLCSKGQVQNEAKTGCVPTPATFKNQKSKLRNNGRRSSNKS